MSEAEPLARPLDDQKCRDLPDAGLNGGKPDQLAVELVEDRADARTPRIRGGDRLALRL